MVEIGDSVALEDGSVFYVEDVIKSSDQSQRMARFCGTNINFWVNEDELKIISKKENNT
jgi:hypothetical protein